MKREDEIKKEAERIYNELCLQGAGTPKEFGEACMRWADEHQKSPWISVEEQLPKPSKMPSHYHRQVLVTRKGIDTAFMANFCEDGKWYILDGVLTEIVAPDYWMPIPELPNE